MKNCFIISILLLFLSCISTAQTNSKDVDPFLGNYTLGGQANYVMFNAHPDSGYEIGYGFFSEDSVQRPVMNTESNNHIISCDGVSGNFLMGSASDEARDEAVFGTMEAVGDSETVVKLYVGQWLNGAWSVVPYTIDSLKKQSNASSNRNLIRMASGYFDGGPAKEFAIAYNLPDSAQMITIRVFKLDGITYRPVEFTSKKEIQFSASLGPQALFDIAAGNFAGNGLDQIVLINNKALTTHQSVDGTVTLSVRAYDFDWTSKQLVPKGVDQNVSLTAAGYGYSFYITDPKYPLIQLVLTSGDFNGTGHSECVIGFSIYWYNVYRLDYYLKPFSLSKDLMNFDFNNNGGNNSTTLAQVVPEDNAGVGYFTNTSMSLATADLDLDGKDELVEADKWWFYIYKLDNTLNLSLDTGSPGFPCYSKTQYLSHRRIAIGDIDGDTTFSDSARSKWYPEIITSEFSVDPRNPTFGADNYNHIKAYKDTGTTDLKLDQVSDLVENYPGALNPSTQMASGGILLANLKGNAIRLGKPHRLAVTNLVEPVVILNAPPIHFDVIGDSVYDICNSYPIGGNSSFLSQYVKSTSSTAELSTTVHSDWGVSSSLSVGGSFLGIGASASLTAKYGAGFSKTGLTDSTMTVTISQSTTWDDRIFATVTDYDLWEYPVYADGVKKGDILAAIAHSKEPMWFPSNDRENGNNLILGHEPGNLLSYPDFGDPDNNPDVGQLIAKGPWLSIDQTSSTTNSWGLTSQTLNQQSADMTRDYGFSANASVEGWGVKVETEANYNHGQINTHTTTLTSTIDMYSQFGAVNNSSASYSVLPYAYWSNEGPLVLDYMVDLPTNTIGGSFWEANYSQKPDLTFNCYYRYLAQKGFTLPAEMADWTKEISISPETPKQGDTVTVSAMIHNYSLMATSGPVQVRFYLGSSENGGMPVLDLNGDSVFATSSPVAARGDQVVSFNWKVPNGIVSSDSILYAVINPDNNIDELKNDNNKGWNRISIMNVTSVGPTNSNQISSYVLSQNYPNPFNPVTRINYQIPKFSHVTIKVYNVLGQEIATLVNEQMNAGHYSVEFNAINFASGIYFYRIKAGDFIQTKKMVLLK